MEYLRSCLKKELLQNVEKPSQNVAYLWQLEGFSSAAPTAQPSPELHFRFTNSAIQPSLLGSLRCTHFAYKLHWQDTASEIPKFPDYGHPMKPFFIKNFWAWANNLGR